jgi:hypothetical protein
MDDNSRNNLNGTFATCLNCIDGRIQLPVLKWIIENYSIDFVDMLTEPGMDGFLSHPGADLKEILRKIQITIDIHNSEDIFIVAHDDCAGNPVDKETHRNQVTHSVGLIKEFAPSCRVIGIWVDLDSNIEKIIEK